MAHFMNPLETLVMIRVPVEAPGGMFSKVWSFPPTCEEAPPVELSKEDEALIRGHKVAAPIFALLKRIEGATAADVQHKAR